MATHRSRPPEPTLTEVGPAEQTRQDFLRAVTRGFHGDDLNLGRWDLDRRLFEFDRSFGFTVGKRWVATCAAFTRQLITPGGSSPIGAVTIVTVAPTHRRQGLLTAMMRHQLADFHRRQEPVALLWASESSIYGRFGYGSAVPRLLVSGRTRDLAFRASVELGDGWVEEVSKEEFGAAVPVLHAQLLPDRPGALDRPAVFWERVLLDRPEDRHGAPPIRYALYYGASGELAGYARFKVAQQSSPELVNDELEVIELDAVDAPARAALWRFLLDFDLVRRFKSSIAVDEPLRQWLADPRILDTTLTDSTYVRIVDLPPALASRRYCAAFDLVVQIHDELLEHNHGIFRIIADAGEPARVTRTSDRQPDLSLGIRELGMTYLGGVSLATLHRAGLVTEHTPGAVSAMALAFDWPIKPYCPDNF